MNEIPKALSRLEPRNINHYNNTGFEVGQQCCLYDYNIRLAIYFFSQAIKQWHCIISYLKSRHCCYKEFTEKEKGTRYSVEFPQKWEQLEGSTYLGHQQTGGMKLQVTEYWWWLYLQLAFVSVQSCMWQNTVTLHLAPSHTLPLSSPLSPTAYLSASLPQKPTGKRHLLCKIHHVVGLLSTTTNFICLVNACYMFQSYWPSPCI